jgi:hypothetical protein
MKLNHKAWYLAMPKRWVHLRYVPLKRLWVMIVAVFLLFTVIGFYYDLIAKGEIPYAMVVVMAIYSGLNAALWIIVLARLSLPFLLGLIALQFFTGPINMWIGHLIEQTFHPQPVPSEEGIHFAASSIMIVTVSSYIFFIAYIRGEGKETFRIRNELELAHGIQKTLVPAVAMHTTRFEIFGISRPSERVGGDLVDAVCLPNGDAVAYIADVAGHGLAAGILMGMLKTAIHTALLDTSVIDASRTLPILLDRLNRVLPDVKEPHMYATFTGFRLNGDGSVFYALAASPPFLHWSEASGKLRSTEEEQFPLGLLPVSDFTGSALIAAAGDLIVVATDGVLEVCSGENLEFGIESLEALICKHAAEPLSRIAEHILAAANSHGRQIDDQTLLLIRCQ